jgi:hypothetical protein
MGSLFDGFDASFAGDQEPGGFSELEANSFFLWQSFERLVRTPKQAEMQNEP